MDKPGSGLYVYGLPFPSEFEGQCFTCGFLRLAVPTRAGTDYREMDWPLRLGVEPCLVRIQSDKEHTVQPTTECVIGVADLPDEIGRQSNALRGDFERAASIVFKKDRKCPKWQPYSRDKSIQQFYTEVFLKDLEKLRQQFQEDWERRQREFSQELALRDAALELQIAKRSEELQAERDQEQRRGAKLIARITIIGLVVALAQVLTLTKDSLLWKAIARCYHLLSGD